MADKGSLGRLAAVAINRLDAAMATISTRLKVAAVPLPRYARDSEHLRVAQLEALAAWAETVAGKLDKPRKAKPEEVARVQQKQD